MSQYAGLQRIPVDQQIAQRLETVTIPAPTRGIIMDENEAYMQPGAAVVCDNWKPTLRGVSLRGGCVRWVTLPETTPVISAFHYSNAGVERIFAGNATKLYDVTSPGSAIAAHWQNSTYYNVGDLASDIADGTVWRSNNAQITPAVPVTFAAYRAANPSLWTAAAAPPVVKAGQASGNYSASQLANQGGNWMIVVNDAGDYALRYNGSTWVTLNSTPPPVWVVSHAYAVGNRATDSTDGSFWKCAVAHTSAASGTFAADRAAHPTFWTVDTPADGVSWITGPAGTAVANGANLVYVCKYRNRFFFIEKNSMNAWYLPLNAVGGALALIPLSGAATKGGKLLFIATWTIDAGDGIDDKLIFCTDLGELLIFTGSDPSSATGSQPWHQEGRFQIDMPMGLNAHTQIGGDVLIATMSGIVPVSAAITKSSEELELAAITRQIRPMWRDEVNAKVSWSWTMENWPRYGGIFVTLPGGAVGNRYCAVVNASTGAWARYTGWDATCFVQMGNDMFFGTQDGYIMQADHTGFDDGKSYVATLVGGWDMFQSPGQTITWRQARAIFSATAYQPFIPQIAATMDYIVTLPTPPPAGADVGTPDLWDQGIWNVAKWDTAFNSQPVAKNTGWVSIGATGFSHAPIVQVTVSQQNTPDVNLIAISATFERGGINV